MINVNVTFGAVNDTNVTFSNGIDVAISFPAAFDVNVVFAASVLNPPVGKRIIQQILEPFDPVAAQILTDTFADIDGSSFTFTPASPSSQIKYAYSYEYSSIVGTAASSHSVKLLVDGVLEAKSEGDGGGVANFPRTYTIYEHVIPSPGIAPITIKMQARRFAAFFPVKLHETFVFDGVVAALPHQAVLTITEYL